MSLDKSDSVLLERITKAIEALTCAQIDARKALERLVELAEQSQMPRDLHDPNQSDTGTPR